MTEDHSSPIKTPKQLVIVVLLAFAVPIAIAGTPLAARHERRARHRTTTPTHVLARIQPVGTVVLAEATRPEGHADRRAGLRPGLQDLPRRGARRRAQDRRQGRMGQDHRARREDAPSTMRSTASTRCRPRGGNSDLTDDEVKRAVVFMASKAGANWNAPPVARPPPRLPPRQPRQRRHPPLHPQQRQPPRPRLAAAERRARGRVRRQEDLRHDVRRLPRRRHRRRAEVRRQGRVGAAHQDGHAGAVRRPRSRARARCLPRAATRRLSDADVKAAVDYMVNASK